MRYGLIVLILNIMIFNLSAQNEVYDLNGNKKSITSESVDLEFLDEGVSIPSKVGQEAALSLVALLPKVVDMGFKAIGKALKKREKSFTGEYEIQKGNIKIGNAKVPSLVYRREVILKGGAPEIPLNALEIKLKANPTENFIDGMYYSVEHIKLKRSKARITSGNNKLDYAISIKLSFFVEKEGKRDKEVIELNTIKIPYVEFSDEGVFKADQYISDIILLPPGARVAEVGLKIVESNPAKIRAEKISALFEKHQEAAKTIINNVLPKANGGGANQNSGKNGGNDKDPRSKEPNKPVGSDGEE